MDGVTEPCFRDLVLARNAPDLLGGAFTEFVRVSNMAIPTKVMTRELGPERFAAPVGLQLMGSDPELVALSAQNAEQAGAPLVDLNFGCPAKGALRGCAGSAMLREPAAMEALVRACVQAVEVPVTAKIRAGYDDDSLVEELARAAEAGGAALLTVHCRTRAEAYQDEVYWTRIARAVSAVGIPVCGNGGVLGNEDLERMREETGCAYVMVGRAALADPWIFSGRAVSREEAAGFLIAYAELTHERVGVTRSRAVPRLKQLLRHWTAGGLVESDEDRRSWLRESDGDRLLARLRELARPLSPAFASTLLGAPRKLDHA